MDWQWGCSVYLPGTNVNWMSALECALEKKSKHEINRWQPTLIALCPIDASPWLFWLHLEKYHVKKISIHLEIFNFYIIC